MFLILNSVSGAQAGVVERNNFLTEMLSLAEKPKAYFIIDLGGNKINLMARGVSIREWTINSLRFSGNPPPVKAFTLEKKSIQLDNLRPVSTTDDILNSTSTTAAADKKTTDNKTADNKTDENKTPSIKKETKYELVALEIDDMPASYSLFLNGDVTINVKSQAEGSTAFLKKTYNAFKLYACYPILEIWNAYHKKTHTEINISFEDKTEAQALFWAFTETTECIVLPPGTENRDDFKF
jgi:hypothetical protein